MPRRCAFGCPPDSKIATHKFPHPIRNPEVFKRWVHIVGGKLRSPSDYKLYANKIVCDIHFTFKDKNRNNRINAKAIPTLHVGGKLPEDSLPIRSVRTSTCHHSEITSKLSDSDSDPTSDESSIEIKSENVYCSGLRKIKTMSGLGFLKSTKSKIILGTVAALHLIIYFAKPSFFKEQKKNNEVAPKYLP